MTTLSYTPAAQQDLAEIALWIAADNPAVAFSFVDGIQEHCAHLQRHPLMGRPRAEHGRSVRSFAHPPYTIFYRYNDASDEVEVLRVWHGRRRQPRLSDLE